MIRVRLPMHLRNLAGVAREIELEVPAPVTISAVLDLLERNYPALRGTLRRYDTGERRPFIRFFAGGEDISHDPTDRPLPAAVVDAKEHLLIIGAMAGG